MSINAISTGLRSTAWFPGIGVRTVALFAGFLALVLRPALFDPDYYWHIETGRLIVAQHALPAGDPFSFTRAGAPWVLHEWLFEVLLYGVFATFGPLGVKLMSGLLGTAVVGLVYATARKLLGRPAPAAWLASVLYVALFMFVVPRPQLITYVFVSACFYILACFKYSRETRLLPLLPVIMIFWANFHGGYFLGITLIAVFCISEWLSLLSTGPSGEERRRLRQLTIIAIVTILASLLNPYFVALWAYPIEVMTMELTQDINEWKSTAFSHPLGKLLLLLVAGFCILQIYRTRKPDLTELAVPGLFIAAGFASIRHVGLAALAMTIFAASALRDGVAIGDRLSAHLGSLLHFRRRWLRWTERGKSLGRAERLLNLAVAVTLGVGAIVYYPRAEATESAWVERKQPVGAVQFLIDHGIAGRMFNSYGFGGYLIHRLYPQQRVYIDGRADMYGDEFFREYLEIARGGRNWSQTFDKYRIDFVVCLSQEKIRQLLLERGDFRLVFEDAVSSVLVKNDSRFAEIPEVSGHELVSKVPAEP